MIISLEVSAIPQILASVIVGVGGVTVRGQHWTPGLPFLTQVASSQKKDLRPHVLLMLVMPIGLALHLHTHGEDACLECGFGRATEREAVSVTASGTSVSTAVAIVGLMMRKIKDNTRMAARREDMMNGETLIRKPLLHGRSEGEV